MTEPTPLLIISDAPSAPTGLARICRDLATRIHKHLPDIFDVGTLGYGGPGDRSLGFPQYTIEGMHEWFIPTLRDVWENFAGDRKGVVMTIWDASRLLWFARPQNPAWCADPAMRAWLLNAPFKKWGYFPIDASGPNGKLSVMNGYCVEGFDSVLAYSQWGMDIIGDTLPKLNSLDYLPHGIDTSVFKPTDQMKARETFLAGFGGFNGPTISIGEPLIGIVATNQIRKDWGVAIEAVAQVIKKNGGRLFIQTDQLERHWSIPALLMDHGILQNSIVNCSLVPDKAMALMYSACDLTLGIGPEGFGYPIFESLACGTPVLCGDVGGHVEHLNPEMIVKSLSSRIEGPYNSVRPVYSVDKWVYYIDKWLKRRKTGDSLLPVGLDWHDLWPEWEDYLRMQHNLLVMQRNMIMLERERAAALPDQIPPPPGLQLVPTSSNSETGTDSADHRTSTVDAEAATNCP